ncbi:Histone-lysine N-methyltransferase SUVR4 [Linum grandiflorum]
MKCWIKCGCSKRCGNRVVHKGIRAPLQVFATLLEKVWGMRSATTLKKETFICEYISKIVWNRDMYERNKERAAENEGEKMKKLSAWTKDEEALCLDKR